MLFQTEEDEDILKQVDALGDDEFDVKEEKIATFFTNWKVLFLHILVDQRHSITNDKELPEITKPDSKNDVFLKLSVETNGIDIDLVFSLRCALKF